MDSKDELAQAMEKRLRKSAEEELDETSGQIMDEFIASGYSKDDVLEAFLSVLKKSETNEYG